MFLALISFFRAPPYGAMRGGMLDYQSFKHVVKANKTEKLEIKNPDVTIIFKPNPAVEIEAYLIVNGREIKAGNIFPSKNRFGFHSSEFNCSYKLKSRVETEIEFYILKDANFCELVFFSTHEGESFVASNVDFGNITVHGETVCFIHHPPMPVEFTAVTVGTGFMLEQYIKNSNPKSFFSTQSYHNITNPYAAFTFTHFDIKRDSTFTYIANIEGNRSGISLRFEHSERNFFITNHIIEIVQIPEDAFLPLPTSTPVMPKRTPFKTPAKTLVPRTADLGGGGDLEDDDEPRVNERYQASGKRRRNSNTLLILIFIMIILITIIITGVVLFLTYLNKKTIGEEDAPLLPIQSHQFIFVPQPQPEN
ncbi:hypothetical protein TVAG_061910 [Trichomonas vaginalis G3]|uniref:Uncharacterized protein n=1 Tax=Trichomonas vaginalis (strain ATCC PRA-98 / G3) TaxID=412133 RepID=A2E7V6_TRIV3|nr:hypothetical protein TVAGG3_0282600 [Trichomonas vaginalis G3]EAY11287.1 hypothetical protein TVAG_061910 [Trichomonas vaginalis G3]KAI5526671.1 hypothetical protein TVAGG3_0282600 [Trichomonas vaginalis G3]|eukprot:XP_001323510.1 hypothetical protein [Trichomonas vaginalis G3]